MPEVLRVFLDANILFSASYRENHDFLELWREQAVVCLTSFYAADEARRNCVSVAHAARLTDLLESTHFVSDATSFPLPARFALPAKDQPILQAALQAGADYLITGDKDFAPWMDKPIPTRAGILKILRPRPFLNFLRERV